MLGRLSGLQDFPIGSAATGHGNDSVFQCGESAGGAAVGA